MPEVSTTAAIEFVNTFSQQVSGLAGGVAEKATTSGFTEFLTKLNWAVPSWDIIIFLFFGITVIIYSFSLGRDRIIAILVSTYIALAVTFTMPFMVEIEQAIAATGFFAFQVSSFVVVFVLTFILVNRSVLVQGISHFSGKFWQVILFSILLVGLLVSIILSFLPDVAIEHLSAFTQVIFLSDLGRFLWIVLPVVALVFLGRRRYRRGGVWE